MMSSLNEIILAVDGLSISRIFGVLIIIICVFLAFFVLIQKSEGGLSSSFGGSGNQIFGAKNTANTLEKSTWFFALLLVALTLICNI
ncbi:MAG: preprotein translocase subunit SecG [Flavobacteriales bacterium]|nr:preprotein translocase subunit SecG [Flavobacteriales bacterium]